jgi:hypothetical protein
MDERSKLAFNAAVKYMAELRLDSAGGGGYPPPPAPPDPNAEAQARITEQNNQARLDSESKARADADKVTKDAADEQQFQSKLGSSYNQAQSYGNSKLSSMGIEDKYGIMPAYSAELDRTRSAIPDKDPNPGNYFTPTLWQNALDQQRGVQRGNLNRQFDAFAAPNFELNSIPDNADSSVINSIVGDQYNLADQYLQRANNRGQLDSSGFDYAQHQLQNSKAGATSRATQLGQGVLQKDRDVLTNIGKEGRDRITNWNFGDTFDPNAYSTRIKSQGDLLTGSLEGDIRNSFGDTQFFDPATLVTKAGAFQGQQNPGMAPLATGGGAPGNPLQAQIASNLKTSAGSQGAF